MVATPPGDFSSAHLLMTFHGTLPGGEYWSVGIRTDAATPDATTLDNYALYADMVFQNTLWSPGGTGIGISDMLAGGTYDGCLLRALNIAGVTTSQHESAEGVPHAGAGASQTSPDQVALVMSLHTNVAGRHGKGRIYLPITAPGALQAGRLSAGVCLGLAKTGAYFIRQLGPGFDSAITYSPGTRPTTLFAPAVQSRTSHVAAPPITDVAVGDVLDTMRRRRMKLKESYSTQGVATSVHS